MDTCIHPYINTYVHVYSYTHIYLNFLCITRKLYCFFIRKKAWARGCVRVRDI